MHIHFIGIGGIGVSALAKYYAKKNHTISGSDVADSEIINPLRKLGIEISIGPHKAENLPSSTELLVYSPAIKRDNPEYKRAEELGVRLLSYPEALGELTRTHFTIAISGTHGKSTTASIIGLLLDKAGLDPTVIVGTKLKEFENSNCRIGNGEIQGKPLLVIEACEHFASFLNYTPDIIILTSLEEDHMDFYRDLNHIAETFRMYVAKRKQGGVIVANKDDKNLRKLLENEKGVVWYSLTQPEADKLRHTLKVPGTHNISNALSALMTARLLNIPDETSMKALSEFKGTWRRFEIFEMKNYTLVSDYAHHPTEIAATMQAAREKWPERKIWLVFQAHQYQRTQTLFEDFVTVLSKLNIDKLILADIYDVPGRESKGETVSTEILTKAVKEHTTSGMEILHIADKKDIQTYLETNIQGEEVVIVMGAGDIYALTRTLTENTG